MTKDVLISVKGLQLMGEGDQADPIEVVTVGEYYFRNGHHYVKYDEVQEGFPGNTINYIKANDNALEVRKKGISNVHMVFEREKKNVTYYQTPMGNLQMGISATKVQCQETDQNIDIYVDYALELNNEHVADCFIQVNIQPKASKDFHFYSEQERSH